MKKYLITSAAALALCGLITSCTHELDYEASVQNSVVKKYEDAFVTAFGKPDPNQEWGFGSSTVVASRAMTRGSLPDKPTFRDGEGDVPTISKPTKPTYDVSSYEDKTGQTFNVSNAENGKYKVDGSSTIYDLGNYGCSLYVVGDITLTGFSAHGTNIIVAAGKKLTLGSMNQHVNIYLEENAELDIRYSLDWQGNVSYDWEGKTGSFTFDNNNTVSNIANLYMAKGSKVYGTYITFKNGYKVLNEGGTITTTNLTVYDSNTSPSTLWNNGGVTVTGNLSCENQNAYVYNGNNHTISVAGNLSLINNNDLVYNNGTVNVSGNIFMTNTSAEIINNDSLLCAGDFEMTAGGAFHNNDNGIASITGKTYIYNTNSRWMNDGHYTTGSFENKNCEQVFNNCYMTVLGEFYLGNKPGEDLGHCYFILDGGEDKSGAYVEANSFTFGKLADLWLGNKSFIDVTTTFDTDNTNTTYGTHGPSSGSYAVIRAASFTKQNDSRTCMTYYGKLYIDTPIHYSKDYFVYDESTVKFSFEDSNKPVSIPKTECNPGYNYEHHDDQPGVIRVICEDLSVTQASDWDFNDVVFDVQLADNNTKVKVTLLAAGGTLPLIVGDMDHEVHELFAAANPDKNISTSSMINTGSTGEKYTFINCKEATFYLDVKSEWFNDAGTGDDALVKAVAKNMPVQVYKLENDTKTWVTMECKKGEPAAKIAVGQDYNWCDERTDIRDKFKSTYANGQYSNFTLYVKGIIGDGWYNNTSINQEQADRY